MLFQITSSRTHKIVPWVIVCHILFRIYSYYLKFLFILKISYLNTLSFFFYFACMKKKKHSFL
jgi:hypothetical protein